MINALIILIPAFMYIISIRYADQTAQNIASMKEKQMIQNRNTIHTMVFIREYIKMLVSCVTMFGCLIYMCIVFFALL